MKDKFKRVIDKLPHSESRVPYTYHHDLLRMTPGKFYDKSRSEIASMHNHDEDQLYALSLVYIMKYEPGAIEAAMLLTGVDYVIIKRAFNTWRKIKMTIDGQKGTD